MVTKAPNMTIYRNKIVPNYKVVISGEGSPEEIELFDAFKSVFDTISRAQIYEKGGYYLPPTNIAGGKFKFFVKNDANRGPYIYAEPFES